MRRGLSATHDSTVKNESGPGKSFVKMGGLP
jgi:hypothetical protein